MNEVVNFVKEFLIPGSVSFLILALSVGLVLQYLGGIAARWGRLLLTLLTLLYWLLSTPFTSKLLVTGLSGGYASIEDPVKAQGATAVVVLSSGSGSYRAAGKEIKLLNGASAFPALEAARVYTLLDDPWVIVSGAMVAEQLDSESEIMREELLKLGVPAERILLETVSQNTRGHATNLAPLLKVRQIDRFVLVTSPTHMHRAKAALEAIGLHPIPSVSAAWFHTLFKRSPFLPTSISLRLSSSHP